MLIRSAYTRGTRCWQNECPAVSYWVKVITETSFFFCKTDIFSCCSLVAKPFTKSETPQRKSVSRAVERPLRVSLLVPELPTCWFVGKCWKAKIWPFVDLWWPDLSWSKKWPKKFHDFFYTFDWRLTRALVGSDYNATWGAILKETVHLPQHVILSEIAVL